MFDITLEIHIWRHCFDDLAVLTSLVESSSSVSSLKIGCHPSLREYVVVPTSRLIDINDLWCLHSIMISAKNWQGGVAPVFFGENGFPDNSQFSFRSASKNFFSDAIAQNLDQNHELFMTFLRKRIISVFLAQTPFSFANISFSFPSCKKKKKLRNN